MNHHSFGHAIDREPWPDVPLQQCESCERRDETVRRRLNRKGTPRLCGRCFVSGKGSRAVTLALVVLAAGLFGFGLGERRATPQVQRTEFLIGDSMTHVAPVVREPANGVVAC